MKFAKRFLLIVAVLVVVSIGAMVIWSAASVRQAEPAVDSYLLSSDSVTVADEKWLVFQPVGEDPVVGLIFYPGANVEAPAYAPALYTASPRLVFWWWMCPCRSTWRSLGLVRLPR